jgi:hypothetical protein
MRLVDSVTRMTHLLDRYDELICLRLADSRRLRRILRKQGRVILALDGLQPDVGHEVLWVLRDCLSGEVLLARSLLSSTEKDVAALIQEVKDALPVAIVAVVSDGQRSIRKAVAKALPNLPHHPDQLWSGASGGQDPGQSRSAAGGRRASSLPRPAAADGGQSQACPIVKAGPAAVPEGHTQLLGRLVPLLRCAGPAADQQ